jgi:hypothetical protein
MRKKYRIKDFWQLRYFYTLLHFAFTEANCNLIAAVLS